MRTIALEEHFATPAFLDGPDRRLKERAQQLGGRFAALVAQLIDVGDGRVAAMDAAGVDVQALSLTAPGVEQLDVEEAKTFARDTNAALAEAIRRHPTRFFGLAALPIADPPAAVAELERVVAEHGFKGVVINGHHRGRYLDDRFFWPVLARAERLKLPIYLHPTQPPQPVIDAWFGGLEPMVGEMMAGAGWGWHIETALHVLRMIVGGVFDAHPELQIVVGHMGETLPFMLQRVRRHGAGDDQAQEADQRLSARERPLHVLRLQLPADVPRTHASGRRRPDHVFDRSSLSIDGRGPRFSRPAASQRRRPGENSAWQRGTAVRGLTVVLASDQRLSLSTMAPIASTLAFALQAGVVAMTEFSM